jgi:riboflavin synthase
MFTGIIRHIGSVAATAATPAGRRLTLDIGPLAAGLAAGASLAVDGACLTAARLAGEQADFDVVPETLARTTLGALTRGDKVNLEPALLAGAALDGHIVQGHVDGLARLDRVERATGGVVLHLRADDELTAQMVVKGSVALAGVSLTLAAVDRGRFSVALIPTTLRDTTLGQLRDGDPVNVELDILGKYVRRYLQSLAAPMSVERLKELGY